MPSRTAEEAAERIIWSADLPGDIFQVLEVANQMEGLEWLKLDRLFLDREGREVIELAKEAGYSVFADAKLIEVPSKLAALAELYTPHRPEMLNCMAGSVSNSDMVHEDPELRDGLKRFADVCLKADVRPCGVTVLTSKTKQVVKCEFGKRSPVEQVLVYAGWLVEAGFTDLVCSPEEAEALRADSAFSSLQLNTPGIRFADADADDQARKDTPASAINNGADRLVVGRPLTKGDPTANFQRLVQEVQVA